MPSANRSKEIRVEGESGQVSGVKIPPTRGGNQPEAGTGKGTETRLKIISWPPLKPGMILALRCHVQNQGKSARRALTTRGPVDTIHFIRTRVWRVERRVSRRSLGGNTMADAQFTTYYDFR